MHSLAFAGDDVGGVFVAAGFVGNEVAGHGAGGGCAGDWFAVLRALVAAVGHAHAFGKRFGGAVAECGKGFAVAFALRHGKAQIAVNGIGLAVLAALCAAFFQNVVGGGFGGVVGLVGCPYHFALGGSGVCAPFARMHFALGQFCGGRQFFHVFHNGHHILHLVCRGAVAASGSLHQFVSKRALAAGQQQAERASRQQVFFIQQDTTPFR